MNEDLIDLDNMELPEPEVEMEEPEETGRPQHYNKEKAKPKMCERKDFVLIDLMCNNCNRTADLMVKLNKLTELLLSQDLDKLSDEDYHKLLKSADNVNKMLVALNSMV